MTPGNIRRMMMQRYCDLQRSNKNCFANDTAAILRKKNSMCSNKLALSQKGAFSAYLPHYRTLTSLCNTTKPGSVSYKNFFL